jgi:hypothetical protein
MSSVAAERPDDEIVVAPPAGETNRWLVLVIVCLAQFMVILDATVVNVALPSIQRDLGFSPADLQWVINAYTLTFGGFLLLGGRAGDLFGRRKLFVAGVVLFSSARADGASTAPNAPWAARAAASTPNDPAAPPTADASAKPSRPPMNAHLRPNRSPRRPPSSSSEPNASV